MALVNQPAGNLAIHFRDETGSKASANFSFPYATLASVVFTAADLLSAALNAITGCAIDGYTITYTKQEDTPEAPADGSRVENKGQFTYRTANARTSMFTVPGIEEAVLTQSGAVNLSNSLIVALNTAVVGGDLVFCAADGSDLTAILHAEQKFRRTGKAQSPR